MKRYISLILCLLLVFIINISDYFQDKGIGGFFNNVYFTWYSNYKYR